jgi:hypothetical protein
MYKIKNCYCDMKKLILSSLFFLFILTPVLSFGQIENSDNVTESSGQITGKDSTVNIKKENTVLEADKAAINKDISTKEKAVETPSINAGKTQIDKIDNKNTAGQVQIPAVKTAPLIINENGLLEINDDDLKYRRIPGIKIHKEKQVIKEPEEIKNIPDEKQSSDTDEPRGIFGLKKSTSGIVVKILLICFIIVIIILFKVRPKIKGNRKVVRRFPGA